MRVIVIPKSFSALRKQRLVDGLKYINAVPAGQREQAFVELAQVLFLSNEFRFQD